MNDGQFGDISLCGTQIPKHNRNVFCWQTQFHVRCSFFLHCTYTNTEHTLQHKIKKIRNGFWSSGCQSHQTRLLKTELGHIEWRHWVEAHGWGMKQPYRVYPSLTAAHVHPTKTEKMRNHWPRRHSMTACSICWFRHMNFAKVQAHMFTHAK